MLTHAQALKRIHRHVSPMKKKRVPLSEALGQVLAENIHARFPFPAFDNSAVDGFAVRYDGKNRKRFDFSAELPAGHAFRGKLKHGTAAHVFTGAPVPSGTESVVMQEYAERVNGSVLIHQKPELHANIRLKGEDFQSGDLLLKKGTVLEPQHMAVLATAGHGKVPIYRAPRVAFFATGDELLEAGERLRFGKIYDSNTPLLQALVRKAGAFPALLPKAADEMEAIRKAVRQGLKEDVLVVCGGVSVGKYDLVKEVFRQEGVREIFWKVAIKPGKPLFFGKKNGTLVFGLPGNPVSAFVCFEEFVRPALLKMQSKPFERPLIQGKLIRGYRNGARRHFIRVQCQDTRNGIRILPLKGQGSHQVGELAKANAILEVAPNARLKKGRLVNAKLLGG